MSAPSVYDTHLYRTDPESTPSLTNVRCDFVVRSGGSHCVNMLNLYIPLM